MRKKIAMSSLIIAFIFILVACTTNDTNEQTEPLETKKEAAIQIAEKFVEKMYTISYGAIDLEAPEKLVEHQELLSTYVTEEAYEDLMPNEMKYPVTIVDEKEANLSVEDFQVQEIIGNENELHIEFTFVVQMDDGEEKEAEEIKGEVTVVSIGDDRLEISRYYDQFKFYF
ncbi:hypothetical protein [Pseudogracilibacillus sp. ICA-222130]|uniref:hypothetical protein n=1 Tax=Pseudogracilibacillus sp. ICA-222130 TaxID=3134655 RepID=UPI0030C181B9